MEQSINKVELMGRVGADPRIGQSEEGRRVMNFNLATGEVIKTGTGALKEETTWHRVVAWEGKDIAPFESVKKGTRLIITGKIRTNAYEKDGQPRYIQEVVAQTLREVDSRKPGDMNPS
ncbi:MAG TPA: single-stranded DNA-binding protein [Bacteroidales bacterium]|jgi:single-strand DNA-binding protein|nr:single-stranded DNA-binding protein [Bacteroidales bacterium]MCZ2417109.1 single-stranded DNA-binding protein [Burkholderiales bacterium]OQC58291.1 MAG: Plasmid-derived single-stranded DNA-binding protein [Bacteroidetes bacterium ADurb.Bin013]MBP8998900.1 single-stranded DNA-binding protein [Bacteroidales bacterium]MBV6456061.1 Plasmid-derived single-stranded DNA-binding protein [Bacteroidales bacterium]